MQVTPFPDMIKFKLQGENRAEKSGFGPQTVTVNSEVVLSSQLLSCFMDSAWKKLLCGDGNRKKKVLRGEHCHYYKGPQVASVLKTTAKLYQTS